MLEDAKYEERVLGVLEGLCGYPNARSSKLNFILKKVKSEPSKPDGFYIVTASLPCISQMPDSDETLEGEMSSDESD